MCRQYGLFAWCAMVTFLAGSASAVCIDYRDFLHRTASHPTAGVVRAIAARGDTLYMATSEGGLTVAALGPHGGLTNLGAAFSMDEAVDVAIQGDRAYVADNLAGLQAYDISDPSAPTWLYHIDSPGLAQAITVVPGRALIADSFLGVLVVDIADEGEPRWVANYNPPQASITNMVRQDDLLYCTVYDSTTYGGALAIVDISDPDRPVGISQVPVADGAQDVAVENGLAAVVSKWGDLSLVDVSDPLHPTLITVFHIDYGYLKTVALVNERAIFGDDSGGLIVVDVSDRHHPFVTGGVWDFRAKYLGFAVVDGVLVAGRSDYYTPGYLDLIDFDPATGPPAVAVVDTFGGRIVTQGNLAYVAGGDDGLLVINLQDPASPQIAARRNYGVCPDVALSGDFLFSIQAGGGFRIFDVADPIDPQLLGVVTTGGSPSRLETAGNLLCVIVSSSVWLYDISDPAAPAFLVELESVERAHDVAFKDNFLLVAGSYQDQLAVFDLTYPSAPNLVATAAEGGGPWMVTIAGDYAYVGDDKFGAEFRIFDIADLPAITEVATLPMPESVGDCAVLDGVAYVAGGRSGVRLLDVSRPEMPVEIGIFNPSVWAREVEVFAGGVLVWDYYDGLTVLPLQCTAPSFVPTDSELPSAPLVDVFPNPFNPRTTIAWQLETSQEVQVVAYDLAGRRVKNLANRVFPSGPCQLSWDGRDDRGAALPSGVYLLRVDAVDFVSSRAVNLIR